MTPDQTAVKMSDVLHISCECGYEKFNRLLEINQNVQY